MENKDNIIFRNHIWNLLSYYKNYDPDIYYNGERLKDVKIYHTMEKHFESIKYKFMVKSISGLNPTMYDTVKFLHTRLGKQMFSEIFGEDLLQGISYDLTKKEDRDMTFEERYLQ